MEIKKFQNIKILIVDDEPLVRDLLRDILEGERMIVDEAEDGEIAFEKIKKINIIFVLSDVRMPRCSGVELLDLLQQYKGDVPQVIMMSAFSDLTEQIAISKGALGLLAKPRVMDDLLSLMAEHL